jgi:hypothetical protein
MMIWKGNTNPLPNPECDCRELVTNTELLHNISVPDYLAVVLIKSEKQGGGGRLHQSVYISGWFYGSSAGGHLLLRDAGSNGIMIKMAVCSYYVRFSRHS